MVGYDKMIKYNNLEAVLKAKVMKTKGRNYYGQRNDVVEHTVQFCICLTASRTGESKILKDQTNL